LLTRAIAAAAALHHPRPPPTPQAHAQGELIEQQRARARDLEAAGKQWEARCGDLREAAAGHEARAKEAAAEVLKGNQIIEKLSVRCPPSLSCRRCRPRRRGKGVETAVPAPAAPLAHAPR
jgi:hypothetical protein